MRSSGVAILLYFLGDRESFLFAVLPDGLTVRRLPDRASLEPRAEAFLTAAEPTRQATPTRVPGRETEAALLTNAV